MIDERLLVEDFDATATAIKTKLVEQHDIEVTRDAVLHRREVQRKAEELRSAANRVAKEIGTTKTHGGEPSLELAAESRQLKAEVSAIDAELREAADRARDLLLRLPNLPSPDAPVGSSEDDNVVLETCNFTDGAYDHCDVPHWEVGERMGILDASRSAKISGSMFSLLRGDGARLNRALVNFGLDLNRERYEETAPPHMVRSDTFTATGHLPKFEEDAYRLRDDDLWMIPTGEVPLMSMHRNELLDESDLPRRYMAYTVCFRREAGSAGKDTRGMQRLHEFHKVEMVKLCTLDQVADEFAGLLANARETLDRLELPYRLVDLCTGDLTFASRRIIDLEVWAPGTESWLEVASVGDFGNFQTRRADIHYTPADGSKRRLVNALNGSAIATPRVWAALLEHGYDKDSNTVRLPPALVPYFGAERVMPRI